MDGRGGITAELVQRLLAEQAPQWADLPVVPVPQDGWDNRSYRLGDELTVRLPSHERYAAAVAKEDRWLPVLAPQLPLPIPEPVFAGRPSAAYPMPWSVRRWLPGEPATGRTVADPVRFAGDLSGFLRALWGADATGGPAAGVHSFFRGCPPSHYDEETRRRIDHLAGRVDGPAALAVWQDALGSTWTGRPVWFHGDVAVGNLMVDRGELAAVIDFGTCGVGDPACDLVIAWTFLEGRARTAFAEAVDLDRGAWARARGWALWKALISVTDDPVASAEPLRVLAEVLADPILA
ncbi:MAG: aminoglycoside phosphotransferase family protein [Propionibacteriaceae bacterium]|nr:aminoglycoside phosphotransferase family protein [Propionibacteriaceae bacterium]